MAIIVEDGTKLANANSYGSVIEADNYFAARGNKLWLSLDTAVKEALLVQATDYIELRFSRRFIGVKQTETQSLSWPRDKVGKLPLIPDVLKKACFEYAIRANDGALAPDPKIDESGLAVTVRRQKVGPLEKEFRTPENGVGSQVLEFRPYPAADNLLSELLRSDYGRWIRN